jgi:hypothetical protein
MSAFKQFTLFRGEDPVPGLRRNPQRMKLTNQINGMDI